MMSSVDRTGMNNPSPNITQATQDPSIYGRRSTLAYTGSVLPYANTQAASPSCDVLRTLLGVYVAHFSHLFGLFQS